MKNLLFLFFAFILTSTAFADEKDQLKVMSYNIRTSKANDGENNWQLRKEELVLQIKYHNADIIGMQEVMPDQLKDLADRLTDYDWYGIGRDGGDKGEYSCIFYKKARFKKIDSGTFWLAENSDKIEKGWDAMLTRVCSWVKLKDKFSGKTFVDFNTHFDHKGQLSREKSSFLILEKIKQIAKDLPVVLTGDFNAAPTNPAYTNIISDGKLKDAFISSETPNFGPSQTFSTFYVKEKMTNRIDFIFVNTNTKVLRHAVLTDQRGGRYYSDHLPIAATVVLSK